MSEYILIDVSKHDEKNRKDIREFLERHCLIVPCGVITTCPVTNDFQVVYK